MSQILSRALFILCVSQYCSVLFSSTISHLSARLCLLLDSGAQIQSDPLRLKLHAQCSTSEGTIKRAQVSGKSLCVRGICSVHINLPPLFVSPHLDNDNTPLHRGEQ